MSSTRKPKLDYEEQIKKLKSLGILFIKIYFITYVFGYRTFTKNRYS